MPTYQYECRDCHNQFDLYQKFSEEPLSVCPSCEGSVRRVIQNVGVVFKGSGWYITDSRGSSRDSATGDEPAAEKAGAEKAAEPATSTKSEAKPKAESPASPAPAAT